MRGNDSSRFEVSTFRERSSSNISVEQYRAKPRLESYSHLEIHTQAVKSVQLELLWGSKNTVLGQPYAFFKAFMFAFKPQLFHRKL